MEHFDRMISFQLFTFVPVEPLIGYIRIIDFMPHKIHLYDFNFYVSSNFNKILEFNSNTREKNLKTKLTFNKTHNIDFNSKEMKKEKNPDAKSSI